MKAPELPENVAHSVALALAEDLGSGDVTAALIDERSHAVAQLRVREDALLCGIAWFNETFRQIDQRVEIDWNYDDCEALPADAVVATLKGPSRALLTGERTALNFLQTLSATATATQRFVTAIRGTGARILDTRKTIPGLRAAQKYAVLCGGGLNHRVGLVDAILIKENHIAAQGSLTETVARARRHGRSMLIEVEVETLAEFRQALDTDADRLMLDNFSLPDLMSAVTLRNAHEGPRKELEASGGISLDSVRDIAATGVDFVSVGQITKHIAATDFSLRMGQ
jgi:nicotinate-nucleotide pyrophosphorylase (carboxylating)